MKYAFKRRESVARGFARIVETQTEGVLAGLAAKPGRPPGVEGIHDARRGLKKLRALLRLLRGALGEEVFRHENAALREVAGQLSAARDADVRLATLDALVDALPGREAAPLAPLRRALATDARQSRHAHLEADAITELLSESLARLLRAPLLDGGWELLGPGVQHAYRTARAAFRKARRTPYTDALHTWRKRAKDCQYQVQLLHRADPAACDRLVRRFSQLTEWLGEDHDLAVLDATLVTHGGLERPALASLRARLEKQRRRLQRKALRLGRELFADRPDDFEQRLGRVWKRWRGGVGK